MMKYVFYTICFSTLFLTSCKTISYNPDNYQKEQLCFGSGGGFTGAINEYTLLSNGQLFKKNGDHYMQVATLDKNDAKQFFENYELLKMDKRIMNDPGNMYYYIKRTTPDSFYKAMWGGLKDVDQRIKIFYANMMRMARDIDKSNPSKTK